MSEPIDIYRYSVTIRCPECGTRNRFVRKGWYACQKAKAHVCHGCGFGIRLNIEAAPNHTFNQHRSDDE